MLPATEAHLVDDLERALDSEPSSPLSRSRAPRELLTAPDLSGLLVMAVQDWVVIAVAWGAMAMTPGWAWPLFILVIASRIHAFGVILHDAAHMPLRRKGLDLRLLELLAGYPLATTVNAMRYHHIRHHRDNGMPTDPYFKEGVEESRLLYSLQTLRGLLLMPFWTVRPYVGVLAWLRPSLRNGYARVFLQDKSDRDHADSAEVVACAREELGQLVFQLGVLALWWSFPVAVLYGYVLPAVVAGVLAARRLLVEHHYTRAMDRRVETILATTRDHGFGPLRWLLAPRNIGLHIVHHIHPQVGLRHLPALREWYLQSTPEYPR